MVKRTYSDGTVLFGIHEVFYDYDDDPEPGSCTVEPVEVFGESLNELRETLNRMLAACDRPVFDYNIDFKEI